MIPRPRSERAGIRTILVVIILATLPCYCLGYFVLQKAQAQLKKGTNTPTSTLTITVTNQPTFTGTLSQTVTLTPSQTGTATETFTPTVTRTRFMTPTRTSSRTPTDTPVPSSTPITFLDADLFRHPRHAHTHQFGNPADTHQRLIRHTYTHRHTEESFADD